MRLDGRGRRGRRRGRHWWERWRRRRGRRRGGRRWRRRRAVGQVTPAVIPRRRYLGLEAVVDHTLLAVGKGVGALPAGRTGEGEECSGEHVDEEVAGCRQGGRRVRGGAMGQRPGRTPNMSPVFATRATSQSRGWLKLRAYCQVRRGGGEGCSGERGVQRRRAAGKAGGARAVARWGSGRGVPGTCIACS